MKRVKDPVGIMQALVADGYTMDADKGYWLKAGYPAFAPAMWQYCGEEKPVLYTWKEEWLTTPLTRQVTLDLTYRGSFIVPGKLTDQEEVVNWLEERQEFPGEVGNFERIDFRVRGV